MKQLQFLTTLFLLGNSPSEPGGASNKRRPNNGRRKFPHSDPRQRRKFLTL